jgi:hypothetical protein
MYDDKVKQYIYHWREQNIDKYREITKEANKKHYALNREKVNENCRKRYLYKTECKRMREILI